MEGPPGGRSRAPARILRSGAGIAAHARYFFSFVFDRLISRRSTTPVCVPSGRYMSHPLVPSVMICLALLLSTGWFFERCKKAGTKPPVRTGEKKKEPEKKINEETINAEKRALSAWMRANTWYPRGAVGRGGRGQGRPGGVHRYGAIAIPPRSFRPRHSPRPSPPWRSSSSPTAGILSLNDPISKYFSA